MKGKKMLGLRLEPQTAKFTRDGEHLVSMSFAC